MVLRNVDTFLADYKASNAKHIIIHSHHRDNLKSQKETLSSDFVVKACLQWHQFCNSKYVSVVNEYQGQWDMETG